MSRGLQLCRACSASAGLRHSHPGPSEQGHSGLSKGALPGLARTPAPHSAVAQNPEHPRFGNPNLPLPHEYQENGSGEELTGATGLANSKVLLKA